MIVPKGTCNRICSNGVCSNENKCVCNKGYYGEHCNKRLYQLTFNDFMWNYIYI